MANSQKKTVKPYLITRSLHPSENQESPIHFLREWITSEEYFYIRNHFPYPQLPERQYLLPIDGEVEKPIVFQYENLLSMPSKTLAVTIECSGNKRAHFRPQVYGEQWEGGAISQGVWKGVPLNELLSVTGLKDTAKEVVFEGHDYGKRTDMEGYFTFSRSLPIEAALHPDVLVAYELNGQEISFKQGFPLRIIVPQWYAMASVKWLRRISVIDYSFQGPFQVIDYVYYPYQDSDIGKRPVTSIKVNSTIQQPGDLSKLDTGVHQVKGIAYTGQGVITKVEVSVNNGINWEPAVLQQDPSQPYSWTFWTYTWDVKQKGEYTIMSRAYDSCGRIQPFEAEWNRKGYGYNAVYKIKVKVE